MDAGVAYWQGQLACQRQHRSRSPDNTVGYSLLDTTTHTHTHTHTHPRIDMCSWTTLCLPTCWSSISAAAVVLFISLYWDSSAFGFFLGDHFLPRWWCMCVCVCVCVCFHSSLWMCMFSAEITAPPCKFSRPHPVKIQRSIAGCFESKFVLLMFVCLLHKSPPHQITFVCNGAANLSVRLTACEGDQLSSLCLMNFLLQS